MFCEKCGKPIEEDSRFCPFCGAKVAPAEGFTPVGLSDENLQAGNEKDIVTFIAPANPEEGDSSGEDIPTFTVPTNKATSDKADIPTFKAPSNDIPTFTAPLRSQFDGPVCYYHDEEPAVGKCVRRGKLLCQDCCDSYGVSLGQYAGKHLCYDCTQELVADNIAELTKNKNKIKFSFILSLVGMFLGFCAGISSGSFLGGLLFACVGGVFLSALKVFGTMALEAIQIALSGRFGILTVISIIFNLIVVLGKCVFTTISNTIYYITYLKKTSGFIEQDTEFLRQITEYMEYAKIRQVNRGVDLETLMQEGSALYKNSFAQMVRDQGEEQAEAFMSQCVTRIAENGEIIRDFPKAA